MGFEHSEKPPTVEEKGKIFDEGKRRAYEGTSSAGFVKAPPKLYFYPYEKQNGKQNVLRLYFIRFAYAQRFPLLYKKA